MDKQKGLAPILIILFIALGIGGYLLYQKQIKPAAVPQSSPIPVTSPAPNSTGETANWKTYTNTKLGYSFKYPSDFKLTEESTDRIFISNNLPPSPNCKGGGCNLGISRLSIYFEHLNNPGEDKLNLDEFAQKRRNALLTINKDQENIQISQKYDYEMRYSEGITEGYNHHYYLKLNPDTSFVITASFPSKEEVAKYSELEDQILSTFKFLP